jgi:hypothetical protein
MSLLSRLFRSKAQKEVDALQEDLDRRLVSIQAGLELFAKTTDAFDDSGDEASFKFAQGKHQYFTNALLNDLGHVEELIKKMRLTLDLNNGRPTSGFVSDVIDAKKMLKDTDENRDRLVKICREMIDLSAISAR